MTPIPVYKKIATTMYCITNSNTISQSEGNYQRIEYIVTNFLPSGSGIDNGVKFNFVKSTPKKLVFDFGFHHMDDNGFYDGWTHHKAILTPSLIGDQIELQITGSNRRSIKEYLFETFYYALTKELTREELIDIQRIGQVQA